MIRRVLLAAAAAGAAACGGAADSTRSEDTTHLVRREPLRITVRDTGTLKAKNSVNVKAQIPGTAKIVWLVPEGTEVKEGDKLAELDKTEVQKNIDSLDSQVVQFETDRRSAKTEYEIQIVEGKAAVEKASLLLDIRKMELQRYSENEAPQTLKKKRLGVERAESEFRRRKERHDQMAKLLDKGFVTPAQVEEERIAVLAAELEMQEARDQQDTYLKYTSTIERRQKESALAEGERGLENETQRAGSLLDRKKVALDQAERRYATTVQRLKEAREQFEAMTMKAPAPGIVIYNVNQMRGGGEDLAVGSQVYNEQPFLQIPDLSEMEVVLGIHEADVNKLRLGQAAVVTVDSFQGRRLEAKVQKIATVASERDWRSDIKKFEVILALEKNDLPLKPGLTVKAEVLVGEVEGVLTVPLQAVFVKEGRYFVFADAAGRPERREVSLGESNASAIVVGSGVKEGERVLLWNPEGTEAVSGGASPAAAGGARAEENGGKGAGAKGNGSSGGGAAPAGGGGGGKKGGGKP